MREKKQKWPKQKEIDKDIDTAFSNAMVDDVLDYALLDAELLKVWFKHGLVAGQMTCGLGGSLEG